MLLLLIKQSDYDFFQLKVLDMKLVKLLKKKEKGDENIVVSMIF
jgi:hypothetical protein